MENLIDGLYVALSIFMLGVEWVIYHWMWFVGGVIYLAAVFALAVRVGRVCEGN